MLPQQYCLRWKYHHSNLQTMFSQLLDRGCFCDVTLACEGQLIRAHRVVLCACSTFFDTVLTNYASERDPIIIMKDVTFADIKCLIEFMYKGEINVEHANLASLLKTADDLKIKGLAEVTWRDDDELPPPPLTPQTEFHSPSTMPRSHLNMYDYNAIGNSLDHHHHHQHHHHHREHHREQQHHHHHREYHRENHHQQQQQSQQSQKIRSRTPEMDMPETKSSYSPKHSIHSTTHAQLCTRIPGLPAIPSTTATVAAATAAAAAVATTTASVASVASAAVAAAAAATGTASQVLSASASVNSTPIETPTNMGPKRKRGRPPLDDAYDVFNVKKLIQNFPDTNNGHSQQTYATENLQRNEEQSIITTTATAAATAGAGAETGAEATASASVAAAGVASSSISTTAPSSSHITDVINDVGSDKLSVSVAAAAAAAAVAAASAYQQQHHVHKHRLRQKTLRSSNITQIDDDTHRESEWMNNNNNNNLMDGNENEMKMNNGKPSMKSDNDDDNDDDDDDNVTDNKREHNCEENNEPEDLKITTEMKELKELKEIETRNRRQETISRRAIDKIENETTQMKSKTLKGRKSLKEDNNNGSSVEYKNDLRKKYEKLEKIIETVEREARENNRVTQNVGQKDNDEAEGDESEHIKIENGENLHKSSTSSPTSSTASTSASTSSSSAASASASSSSSSTDSSGTVTNQKTKQSITGLQHHANLYGSYCPDGYMINEHGILMAPDFVHATTAAIPTSSSMAANGPHHGDEYADIKMEEFSESELRLTSEEMTQWQDVIKMDDYLAKGRRPQFWEEPFTRRVLDAIKNKRLEMKKAARILGVSYGTLYGRYRETYGCLKHPYNNSSLRSSQTNALAIPSRFDIVWPSAKPTGQIDIGKLRPKDISELWTRPQI